MGLLSKSRNGYKNDRSCRRVVPRLEQLEARWVPYSTTGNAWPSPQLITISFVPDGTLESTSGTSLVYSNLNSNFNGKFGSTGRWQNIILQAAQSWAQQTNINFAVVPDDGATSGSGAYQQGDPNHGDIRIAGYNFGTSTLATAVFPPPANNYSVGGDIAFNTGASFNINTTYDLFTVASHEFGHALGLGHSSSTVKAVMYPSYVGFKTALNADDIAGIRNIYSANAARSPDAYDAAASNGTFATATDITSQIDANALTALVTGLDVTTTSDLDYYSFTVPSATTGALSLKVQSSGLSLLSPKVTVYAADQTTVLASAGTTGQYGTTLNLSVPSVTGGQVLYVKVAGADATAFGTGAYGMALSLGANAVPTIPLPVTTLADGTSVSGAGGLAEVPGNDVFPDPYGADSGGSAPVSAVASRVVSPAADSVAAPTTFSTGVAMTLASPRVVTLGAGASQPGASVSSVVPSAPGTLVVTAAAARTDFTTASGGDDAGAVPGPAEATAPLAPEQAPQELREAGAAPVSPALPTDEAEDSRPADVRATDAFFMKVDAATEADSPDAPEFAISALPLLGKVAALGVLLVPGRVADDRSREGRGPLWGDDRPGRGGK